jgi:1-acyl-sn-glycerol-3-phosphate acyltransferase
VYHVTRFWSWVILAVSGVTIKVRGLSRLDGRQRYLFLVNHQSNIDIPVLVQSLPDFQLRWIAKKELLWVPFFGWAMWAGKHIVVDRANSTGAFGSLKKAAARIASGISVVVFPEGTRGTDGRVLPFKRGGFLLAAKTGVSIVPVTISGSGKILLKGDWRLRPGIVEVHISDPIPMTDHRQGSLRALATEVQRIVEKNLTLNGSAASNLDSRDEIDLTAKNARKKTHHEGPSAAKPQPKGRRDLNTKNIKVTNQGTAIAVPLRMISPQRTQTSQKFYLARFAPYVLFVVNVLEFVLRGFVVRP